MNVRTAPALVALQVKPVAAKRRVSTPTAVAQQVLELLGEVEQPGQGPNLEQGVGRERYQPGPADGRNFTPGEPARPRRRCRGRGYRLWSRE